MHADLLVAGIKPRRLGQVLKGALGVPLQEAGMAENVANDRHRRLKFHGLGQVRDGTVEFVLLVGRQSATEVGASEFLSYRPTGVPGPGMGDVLAQYMD